MTRVRMGKHIAPDPRYGVDPAWTAGGAWPAVFGRPGPLIVEVGFGDGLYMVEMARRFPGGNFVGIELYGTGILKLGNLLDKTGLGNVRIMRGDAYQVIRDGFGRGEIGAIHINFPDPWPKMRHHKRRLVAAPFAALLFDRMAPGGTIHLATDHPCYAAQMRDVFEWHPGFLNLAGSHRFIGRLPGRTPTKYERKMAALGETIHYLQYRRQGHG